MAVSNLKAKTSSFAPRTTTSENADFASDQFVMSYGSVIMPPYATTGSAGVVQIGNGISVDQNGVISVTSGVSDKNFVFTQAVAADLWEITHNLDKYPAVTVVDSGKNEVIGDIEYIDKNSLKIRFSAAFSGAAYMN